MQTQLSQAAADLHVPLALLDDDVQRVREMIDSVDRSYEGDFHRRLFVRCLFALIESGVFFSKGVLLQAAQESNREISPKERAILEEISYTVDDKGATVKKQMPIKLKHNIQFVAKIISEWKLGSIDLKKDSRGWADFIACIELRNRLTHPRPNTSMNVEDEQLKQLDSTYEWFSDVMNQLAKILYPPRNETTKSEQGV